MKSREVSIKTRSSPASLSFKGQATKHTTVKWSIIIVTCMHACMHTYIHTLLVEVGLIRGSYVDLISNI